MERTARRFLEDLLRTPGPSGFEGPVQDLWRDHVKRFAGKVERDVHGNQWATIPGRSDRSLVLAGHADEVGLIVQYIDDEGFIFLRPIGGVDPAVLPSQWATILGRKGPVRGVFGRRAHHLREKEGDEKTLRLEDMPIDIGASGRTDALKRLEIGDPVVFGADMEALGGSFASARNFDNRIGCFIVAEVLRVLSARGARPGFTVHGISTVQEETGLKGAGNLARRLSPAAAIAIDVTHDTHHGGVKVQKHGDIRCGKGPALTRGVRTSKVLFEEIRSLAAKSRIPHQIETDLGSTHTDADAISESLEGIPVAVVSIPCRYMHTSCEVIHLGDVEKTVELLSKAAAQMDPEKDFSLR